MLTMVLVLLALTPDSADGQRQPERLLILPALPGDPADSLYVLELAAEMRSRQFHVERGRVSAQP